VATEIIRRVLCDVHLETDDEQRDAVTRTVKIDGEAWTLDACSECSARVREFAEWVAKYGRQERGGKSSKRKGPGIPASTSGLSPATGDYPCPADGCDYVGATQAVLRGHARQTHETTVLNLLGQTSRFACHKCEPVQYFESNQGLAMHVNRTHGGFEGTEPSAPAAKKSARQPRKSA
jgi:hypothetical protein